MKYLQLLLAIANLIYGSLILVTLSTDSPGYIVVFMIGAILAIIGATGIILWIKAIKNSSKSKEEFFIV
jgi:hypothetical protein